MVGEMAGGTAITVSESARREMAADAKAARAAEPKMALPLRGGRQVDIAVVHGNPLLRLAVLDVLLVRDLGRAAHVVLLYQRRAGSEAEVRVRLSRRARVRPDHLLDAGKELVGLLLAADQAQGKVLADAGLRGHVTGYGCVVVVARWTLCECKRRDEGGAARACGVVVGERG